MPLEDKLRLESITMKNFRKHILPLLMALSLVFSPINTIAEDIDIFTGASAGASDRPNVLIVLDNTSNWARQSQQWPGGIAQGQAEVRSIQNVLDSLGTDINVGLMEFVTNGDANNIGGFVRFPILQMNATNKAALKAELQEIYTGINTPEEKRNSGTEYGNLAYDVFNYFAGSDVGSNSSSLNPPSPKVDGRGYDTIYSNFKAPLSKDSSCAKNYVIFIGNPSASGPSDDSDANNLELQSVGCSADPVKLPRFNSTTINQTDILGETSGCYSNKETCTAEIIKTGSTEFKYDSNGDGVVDSSDKSACQVTTVTEKGKTSYDGKYLVSDGSGGQKSGCACTTPVEELVGGCPVGQYRFPVYGVEAAGTKKNLVCTSNGNCNKLATYDPVNCSGSYTCSCDTSKTNGCSSNQGLIVRETTTAVNQLVGITSTCAATCSTAEFSTSCSKYAGGCVCGIGSSGGVSSCGSDKWRFKAEGVNAFISNQPTGAYDDSTKGATWHLDEWAQCLYKKGVPVEGGARQTVAMYTIDVYNKQPNADHTALLMSAAHQGGGRYFSATNEGALTLALQRIFAEIQAVNSTFASASLPVNATNRAQNENQVFIGMFRPDEKMQPRWYGNLKRYQLVFESDGVTVALGDKNGAPAVNKQTGFVGDCAVSYWTTDSPLDPDAATKTYYWSAVSGSSASKCNGIDPNMVYSDSPDGPTVEKGAIAEVVRKGNNPPTTDSAPTWAVNRNIYTTGSIFGTGLIALTDSTTLALDGDATRKSWVTGQDVVNLNNPIKEVTGLTTSQTRASLHGDVVHSRPLPVTYGVNDGVIYYGANDGMFRAVDAETGNELWALMPFEFAQISFVDRLRNNLPLIKYSGISDSSYPGYPLMMPERKAYGWDGSIGIAQDKNNTKVWIYPTMRRGGQMVYALDVTNKTSPSIKWKHGCYAGICSAGFENMGQTWSAPIVTPVAGYTTEKVAIFGGGYDTCEDVDSATPPCVLPKGANVYVVDAGSGTLLKKFDTRRSVASEVAVVDMDNDGKADYGYVGDTGANLYRIDMVTRSVVDGAVVYTPLPPSSWTMRRIAKTGSDSRKFLFQPALLPLSKDGRVYVAIGSGDREHPLASQYAFGVTNRFYVYLDDVRVTSGDAIDLNELENKTEDKGCESTSILPGSSKTGWYMDLNQYGQGEQTVTSALILGGQVVFSTNRPIPPASGTCSTVLGEARGYWVNLFNASGTISSNSVSCGGERSSIFVGGGLPPSPVTGNVMVDGKPVTVVIGAVDKDGGASTPISPGKVVPAVKPTRSRIYHKVKGVD